MFPKQGFMPEKKGGVIADYASTSVIHGPVSPFVANSATPRHAQPDRKGLCKLQKAVMREGDGNRVNRREAAGTIGYVENIFFDRKEGMSLTGSNLINPSPSGIQKGVGTLTLPRHHSNGPYFYVLTIASNGNSLTCYSEYCCRMYHVDDNLTIFTSNYTDNFLIN
ncbi:hypothetical protein ALC57_04597 [Trachymyrmex cornetzi]|uniref:Uncharacterized protein n=1 Tax=Trachymyrmex cornetzi TaxID=471704 RepID=A0A195EC65_9HYME|nr:hypothetical protein ALC57_04597 [Trachymyrmex cornetzi]